MSLEAIMITSAIKLCEGKDVAAIDITGEYLHTDLYEEVTMILIVILEDLLVNMYPNLYRK